LTGRTKDSFLTLIVLAAPLADELKDYDLRVNGDWFKIKLLADHDRNANRTTSVSANTTFGSAITQVFKAENVNPKHKCHFGRSQGPAILEAAELESCHIKQLGNWSQDIQEAVYSGKMPFKAMRVAAGYEETHGSHYNARSTVEPAEELQKLIFPQLEQLEEQIARGHEDKTTARAFCYLLRSLRRIILQDAAALMHEGRTRHRLFQHAVFCGAAFQDFKRQVVVAIEAEATWKN
jgi:hypothetical protein